MIQPESEKSEHLAQSLLLLGPRQLAWTEPEPLPGPPPGTALVQTIAGAISVGSELPQYLGEARGREAHYPQMTGYESVGRVVATGLGVERLQLGDRVVSFYGHRTVALVPEPRAIAVPDGISDPSALLAILTCDAAKGVRKLAPLPEEPVLITGAGAIGLFALFILKAYGVAAVDVVEPDETRHALAWKLGARRVLRPEEAESPASPLEHYPAGVECSARDRAFALLQRRLAQGGRICVLSDGNLEPLVLLPEFHAKELQISGSSDGWDYHRHAGWYFDYLSRTSTPLAEVFQEETSAEELPATFERLALGEMRPVKVLVRYRGERPAPYQ